MVSQDMSRRTWGQHPIRKTPPLKSSDHKVGLKFASGRNRDGSESRDRIYGVDTPDVTLQWPFLYEPERGLEVDSSGAILRKKPWGLTHHPVLGVDADVAVVSQG